MKYRRGSKGQPWHFLDFADGKGTAVTNEMKVLTDQGKTFSFSFMSYSIDKNKSHGIVTVEHAKLRAGNRKDRTRYNEYLLNFVDMDTLEEKTCWQPLLLEFNGIMLELN